MDKGFVKFIVIRIEHSQNALFANNGNFSNYLLVQTHKEIAQNFMISVLRLELLLRLVQEPSQNAL